MVEEEYYIAACKCGMTDYEYWHTTLHKLSLRLLSYREEQEKQAKLIAYRGWMYGQYTGSAILSTIGNSPYFKSKTAPLFKYEENPLLKKDIQDRELTEEEKIEQTKALFARLNVRKSNFELYHNTKTE